jgi:hypothetical protein
MFCAKVGKHVKKFLAQHNPKEHMGKSFMGTIRTAYLLDHWSFGINIDNKMEKPGVLPNGFRTECLPVDTNPFCNGLVRLVILPLSDVATDCEESCLCEITVQRKDGDEKKRHGIHLGYRIDVLSDEDLEDDDDEEEEEAYSSLDEDSE